MIRREQFDGLGRVTAWLLVSQVEHARVAGELAQAWNAAEFPLVEPHAEFIAAVLRHDDGWIPWELRPGVHEGKPRDFREMPIDESAAIWRRSIAVAQTIGPLAAYAVAAHFAFLCRHAREKEPRSAGWRDLADEFLEEQDDLQRERLDELIRRGTPQARETADRAWHWLQFFDRVSLWLCCGEQTEADVIDVPEIAAFEFRPGAEGEIAIEPWPMAADTVELAVSARRVPVADYATPADLAQAAGEQAVLRRRFVRRT